MKNKLSQNRIMPLFWVIVAGSILFYTSNSYWILLGTFITCLMILVAIFIFKKNQENSDKFKANKTPGSLYRIFISSFFLFLFIGLPLLIFLTPLRFKIEAGNLSWFFLFYEISILYFFALFILFRKKMLLSKQEFNSWLVFFRKILTAFVFLLTFLTGALFYLSGFDQSFVFLEMAVFLFGYKLYKRGTVPLDEGK